MVIKVNIQCGPKAKDSVWDEILKHEGAYGAHPRMFACNDCKTTWSWEDISDLRLEKISCSNCYSENVTIKSIDVKVKK